MATSKRDALTRFAEELTRLRMLAGAPSLNQLVALTAGLERPLARSTVSDKLTAKSVPDWDFVVSFVTGCRAYAANAGVPLPAALVDLARWETEHWRMLSTLDSADGEDRLTAAARVELGRHRELDAGSGPRAGRGSDGDLAALADLLDELRSGAGGTVVISVVGGDAGIEKAALLVRRALQVADQVSDDRPM
jgi:hypothetical protein